jgi:hypothetical protein
LHEAEALGNLLPAMEAAMKIGIVGTGNMGRTLGGA